MTYSHLRADCLYTGISFGPNAWWRVWEAFTFFYCTGEVATASRRDKTESGSELAGTGKTEIHGDYSERTSGLGSSQSRCIYSSFFIQCCWLR